MRAGGDEWSELDVIVVSAAFAGMTFVDRPGTVWEAVGCPAKVQMLCYTPGEFEKKRREPGVVASACREGIWLD